MRQSEPLKRLESAKAQAETSRTRLLARVAELRARTRPAALADEAKAVALAKAVDLAATAARQPRARTAMAAGAVTAGLAYLFRKPLLKALAKRFAPGDKT